MRNLSICVALLILIVGALLLIRRPSSDNREPEREYSPVSEITTKQMDQITNEREKATQVVELSSFLASELQQEAVAQIKESSQAVANYPDATNEVLMNMSEHKETIPVADGERRRFVGIAFDRAKEGMKIADTSTALVEYKDNIVVVTFPFPYRMVDGRPPYPGPEYIARVKIDRNTGNVLEILGAP